MKSSKHILFRLILLIAILFCLGVQVYTCGSAPVCNTELSSNLNGEENNVFSSLDSLEDDLITRGYEILYFVEPLMLIPISNELSLLKEHSFSSWQPPKLS